MIISSDTHITHCIDWLSVTHPTPQYIKPFWTEQRYTERKNGLNGYTVAWRYLDEAVAAVNPDRADMGTYVQWSGDALRSIPDYDGLLALAEWYVNQSWRVTRIDLAVDIYGHKPDVKRWLEDFKNGECETTMKPDSWIHYTSKMGGETLYFGGTTSKRRVRIYNKAAEQNRPGNWWRIEAQIRGKRATQVVTHLTAQNAPKDALQAIIKGVLNFPNNREWVLIMGAGEGVKMGERKEQGDTLKWLIKQVSPACGRMIAEGHMDEYALFLQAVAEEAHEWKGNINGDIR